MILREGWGTRQVLKSLLWLRRENLNRGHIYVRPSGAHGLSLVDDLKAAAIARMKVQGFEQAVVVETSPGNFQAWLKHGQVLEEATSTRVAKELALRFDGDPGSTDWRHFGRLAGFTNPKPNRRLESGLHPFARLVEANGRVYRQAPAFIAEVRVALAGAAMSKTGSDMDRAGQGGPESPLKALAEFHRDPRYAGDLHRADMAWARHAASMGLSASKIRTELMRARDRRWRTESSDRKALVWQAFIVLTLGLVLGLQSRLIGLDKLTKLSSVRKQRIPLFQVEGNRESPGIDPDLFRFANASAFVSWLGLCPDNRVSGGKILSVRTRAVKNRAAMGHCAWLRSRCTEAIRTWEPTIANTCKTRRTQSDYRSPPQARTGRLSSPYDRPVLPGKRFHAMRNAESAPDGSPASTASARSRLRSNQSLDMRVFLGRASKSTHIPQMAHKFVKV